MDLARRAEEMVLNELSYRPEGMPTLAIIDFLGKRGVPASLSLEVVWNLRDLRRVEMRAGRVVLPQPHAAPPEAHARS